MSLDPGRQPQSGAQAQDWTRTLLELAAAAGLVGVATALTVLVRPYAPQMTYVFFYAAVFVAAMYGSLTTGVAAVLLAVLAADFFVVQPTGAVLSSSEEWFHGLTFAAVALLICGLAAWRRRSAAQLHERERFIANLTALAPSTLYLYDVPGECIAYMTPGSIPTGTAGAAAAAQSQHKVQADALILPQFMLAEDRIRFLDHLSDLATRPDGVVLPFEYRLQDAGGAWRWYERQEQVYERSAGGAVHLVLGVAQDITERKQAEEQVRRQAQLLNSVDQAVIAIDNNRRVTYWNRYAEILYGWGAAEILGRDVNAFLLPPEMTAEAERLMQRLASGRSWSGEFPLRRRDGSTIYVDLIESPLYDDAGKIVGVLGVSVDVSQRKRAESYLQFLADASLELSSSLDYKTTIQRVAELAVPQMADWCAVDLLRPDNTIEMVAVAHVDPDKVRWAHDLRRRFPPTLADAAGLAKVIRTGEPEFYPVLSTEALIASAEDDEQREILRQINFRSLIVVPLRARGEVIGGLTLVWTETNRYYTEPDVIFAEELANRAAVAVDNARLYQEARLAEQQQAELLAQMEALVANAPIGIAFFDRDLRYVRINEAMAYMNNLPVAAHLEHRIDEVVPRVAELATPYIEHVLRTGEPVLDVELQGPNYRTPAGVRYCTANWYPVMVEQGKPMFVGALVIDVTERKLVEQALRESEERFRSTFEQAAVGISHVGLDGRWLRVNNRLCEIAGRTREELLALTFADITYADDLEPDNALVQRALAGEIDGYHLEKRYWRKDGMLIWVHLTVSLVRKPATGEPDYFISVVEDISERKATETQLLLLAESSRVLFTSLVDERTLQAAADLLVPRLADWCVINLRGDDDVIEPVAIAHRDPAKIATLRLLAGSYPLDREDAGTPAVIRKGEPYFLPSLDVEHLQRDSRLGLLQSVGLHSLIIVPMRARGQTLGSITLARIDATHAYDEDDVEFAAELAQRIALAVDNAALYASARAAETQLRQLNETLEERVLERTHELERSNRELDRFAYVASHDLKAPLRAIDNLAMWLHQDVYGLLPSESQEHLDKLRGRVRRMERLLDDLLAYSRAGRVQHVPQEVDTGTMVRGIFDLLSPPPDFTLEVVEPMPVLTTQRVPLETVLRNLIGNAIKHHDRPAGKVKVSAHRSDGWVEFEVEDNGPGVAPEYHDRIFELFQTLQPRDQVEGSGMGLAIVKKTVESAGGQITIESDEGKGTCFRFTWPADQPAPETVLN